VWTNNVSSNDTAGNSSNLTASATVTLFNYRRLCIGLESADESLKVTYPDNVSSS
jgi:hypothetical protein